ncbi:uncharacterized protein UMAG_12249 [Mycosarcoma maydis]|uniref:Uncharacterized protein n=1 Tax=Mycosarcoma maydis TaxID=5270 RepID=A0A0D1DWA3_MYCMD|nr:uncharacterized protein UMAG_12249 [Ustilago maydis 521]KIS67941.1 hypothetical protein UMAG_12249 [Ustilago maydis 521]|eukprot:XP_011390595.1 hypothetical protein UMAG_12249 [Ustilago maydis 521]
MAIRVDSARRATTHSLLLSAVEQQKCAVYMMITTFDYIGISLVLTYFADNQISIQVSALSDFKPALLCHAQLARSIHTRDMHVHSRPATVLPDYVEHKPWIQRQTNSLFLPSVLPIHLRALDLLPHLSSMPISTTLACPDCAVRRNSPLPVCALK